MKKQMLLLAVAALMSGQVWAAAPETVLEKTDALREYRGVRAKNGIGISSDNNCCR